MKNKRTDTLKLRHLALAKQGLGSKHFFGAALSGARYAIEHLGYVQIDTLSVVERKSMGSDSIDI